jgi:hypothetical protein
VRVDEAKAALERAGYEVVRTAVPGTGSGVVFDVALVRFNIEGLGTELTNEQVIQLAHRHGAWPPAFERSHSAGPR